MQNKKEIREKIIHLRNIQPTEKIIKKSSIIKDKLFSFEHFQKAKTVMFYASFRNEVETHFMIKDTLRQGKVVALPKTDSKNKKLDVFQINNFEEDIEKGYCEILEPKNTCKKINIKDIDLVIVPAVAYTQDGYRIGYGGGYYDRFLDKFYTLNKNGISIGLAFEFQIIEEMPKDKFDRKVHFIITEERIIKIKP